MLASTAGVVLDYLRVLAWPVVAVGLVVVVLRLFRFELGGLIERLRSVSVLGVAVTASEQQLQLVAPDEADADAVIEALMQHYQAELAEVEQTREELVRELSTTQIALEFERIFTFIFGSQLRFLRGVRQTGGVGMPVTQARVTYLGASLANAAAYAGFSFEQWIDYLTRQRGDTSLVVLAPHGNYVLTDMGTAFIGYVDLLGYPERGL